MNWDEQHLADHDFYLYDRCRCHGVLKYTYRHKVLVITLAIYPERLSFALFKNRRRVYAGALTQLNTQINLVCQN